MESEQRLSMFNQMFSRPSKGLHIILVLFCLVFGLATCGPCSTQGHLVSEMNGMLDPFNYEACGSYGEKSNSGVADIVIGDKSSNNVHENSPTSSGYSTVCSNSAFFCFPSTLPGFLAEENYKANHADILGNKNGAALPELLNPQESNFSWFSNHGSFLLLNEKIVSCSMISAMELNDRSSSQGDKVDWSNLETCGGRSHKYHRPTSISDKKSELVQSDHLDGSSSLKVEISPHYLDWGQSFLYFPSSAFITVANTCNETILQIYEPFSTDTQFYPCNFDEVSLGPGEVASICFVFLPQQLGLLSAHLILQTSSGGFLIPAKGFAVESLYQIQPFLGGRDISLDGVWSRNLSLYNPFDENLYIKEVTAWISVSSENTSHSAEAVCRMDNFQGIGDLGSSFNGMEWLNMKSDEVDLPMMAIRPHKSWELDPHSSETIMEINFLSGAKGKVFGAFSMQLQSSSQDGVDTVVVPLEVEVPEKAYYSGRRSSLSVYLESIMPCDGCETSTVILSLRNRGKHLLKFSKINEASGNSKIFHIKYMDGLLLYPDTVTQIAVVNYSCPPSDSQEPLQEVLKLNTNCQLHILTNESGSPLTEVSCKDVVKVCMNYRLASYIGHQNQHEKSNPGNVVTGALGSVIQSFSQSSWIKSTLEIAEADEHVLRSWISQGTTSGMSVLDDNEVLFPVVPIGSHCSKWITVKNPSEKPVILQLILNSGAVIDQCKSVSKFLQQPLSRSLVQNESIGTTVYGFSMAETAITEAYIQPYGKAYLGPIVFHPSDRCLWRSSALLRNNLSGVEWLPLHGSGGSLSLTLLEESQPAKSLKFNLKLPIPLNFSPQGLLFNSAACSMPLSKELYAKNTGDFPLKVRKIEVSGTDCGLDGFMVHNCMAFALEPGESRRLLITYQSDFSTATVLRDLELSLATGILVIPMKANLPVSMVSYCRKSFFWIWLKKLTLVGFIAASVIFLVSCCIVPQVMSLGTHDYLFKTESGTICRARKPSVLRNQKNSKFSMYNNVDGMLRSVREGETSRLGFGGRYSDCPSHAQELRKNGHGINGLENVGEKIIGVVEPKTEYSILQRSEAKRVVPETSCSLQVPQAGSLTVRDGKEKSKRRRKRRSAGAGTGLNGLLEVSSSQSGNSTPTSPRSPVSSFTPKRTWSLSPDVDHDIEAKNPFGKVAEKISAKERIFKVVGHVSSLEPEVSGNCISDGWSPSARPQTPTTTKATRKPVLLPSATFPVTSRCVPAVLCPPSFSPSTCVISPHARAPGSNLCKEKTTKVVEKASHEDRFRYDIWGNHLCGLNFIGKGKEVPVIVPNAPGEDSQSFFVMGPQILMQSSHERSVPPAPRSSSDDVAIISQKG